MEESRELMRVSAINKGQWKHVFPQRNIIFKVEGNFSFFLYPFLPRPARGRNTST